MASNPTAGLRVHRLLLVIAAALSVAACGGPESIVEEAVTAAQAGDREGFQACFTPRSRPMMELLWTAAQAHGRPELASLQARQVRLVGTAGMPPTDDGRARVVVTIEESGRQMRLVLQRSAGEWRIDLMDTERALTGFGSPF